jgi:hypothetical protein
MVTTAFVLSGGGSLGAVQVGMLQALAWNGAVNAAWVAGHGLSPDSLDELADAWTGLRRGDTFPVEPRQVLRGLLGRSMGVTSETRLRRLLRAHASIDDLADARVPTHLVAADLLSGHDVLISTGDPVDGVLASAAIPGILPPVERAGRYLVDGSVALHAGVAQGRRPGRRPRLRPPHRRAVRSARPTPNGGRGRAARVDHADRATPHPRVRRPGRSRHGQDPAPPCAHWRSRRRTSDTPHS